MTRPCERCREPVAEEHAFCPRCGAKQAEPAPAKTDQNEKTALSLVLVAILAVGFIGLAVVLKEPQAAQPRTIATPSPTIAERDSIYLDSLKRTFSERGPLLVDSALALAGGGRIPEAERLLVGFARLSDSALVRARDSIRSARVAWQRAEVLAGKWSYSSTTDQMTGRTNRSALIRSENVVTFAFPYEGPQRGTLMLREHPSYGQDVIFSIERGQILCNSFDRCRVRVRFDDGEAVVWNGNPPADHSSETVFLASYSTFIQRLGRSEVVRIQPEVYQEGNPVFEFQVGGFDLTKLRNP